MKEECDITKPQGTGGRVSQTQTTLCAKGLGQDKLDITEVEKGHDCSAEGMR